MNKLCLKNYRSKIFLMILKLTCIRQCLLFKNLEGIFIYDYAYLRIGLADYDDYVCII